MSDGNSTSLVNLGDLSKPANTLIEKASGAVGGLFKPWQIRRVAKAEADAKRILAASDIEVTELQERALRRRAIEEAQHQHNMESVTAKAIPHLGDSTDVDLLDHDWLTNFFSKARLVSDAAMQELWARVLAGEANSAGSFSKRTVAFLEEMDSRDAKWFTNVCRYAWQIDDRSIPLIYDVEQDMYEKSGVTLDSLWHLDSIGLVDLSVVNPFLIEVSRQFEARYHDTKLCFDMAYSYRKRFEIGSAFFTTLGRELLKTCEAEPVDGFVDFVKHRWRVYVQ